MFVKVLNLVMSVVQGIKHAISPTTAIDAISVKGWISFSVHALCSLVTVQSLQWKIMPAEAISVWALTSYSNERGVSV